MDLLGSPRDPNSQSAPPTLEPSPDIQMADQSRPPSAPSQLEANGGPSPAKRLRLDSVMSDSALHNGDLLTEADHRAPTPAAVINGGSRAASAHPMIPNGHMPPEQVDSNVLEIRFASKPYIPRTTDAAAPLRDTRRAAIVAAICRGDDPLPIVDQLRDIAPDNPALHVDIDLVLDDQGHTALHLAASMAQHAIVDALIANGADVHRGNYNGETALVRACLATHNADQQTFHFLVTVLHPSIRTLDSSRKSILHHIVAAAGVKGRAVAARYYLDQILVWIAQHQGADFRSLVDLQDEHGDTALNIAARVGNRSLVRTLLDVGANRITPNKLGLRPGDFGVETEVSLDSTANSYRRCHFTQELGGGPRAEDLLSSLRSGPSAPVLKSQDVLAGELDKNSHRFNYLMSVQT